MEKHKRRKLIAKRGSKRKETCEPSDAKKFRKEGESNHSCSVAHPECIQRWIRFSQFADSRPSTLARLPTQIVQEIQCEVQTFLTYSKCLQNDILYTLQKTEPSTFEWMLDVLGMKI